MVSAFLGDYSPSSSKWSTSTHSVVTKRPDEGISQIIDPGGSIPRLSLCRNLMILTRPRRQLRTLAGLARSPQSLRLQCAICDSSK